MIKLHMNNSRGFTLVELSIVIVIIGFLVAGISAGANLVKSSQLQSVANDFTKYRVAVSSFYSTYSYFPGDMPNAYAYFGSDCGANTVGNSDSCNGDGDGLFSEDNYYVSNYEIQYAWIHLQQANLVTHQLTGPFSGRSERVNVNVPEGKLGGAYTFSGLDSCADAMFGVAKRCGRNTITLGSYDATDWQTYFDGIITSLDGNSLDQKIDDGNNYEGEIWIVPANSYYATPAKCTNGAWHSSPDSTLNFSDTEKSCRIIFLPKEFTF